MMRLYLFVVLTIALLFAGCATPGREARHERKSVRSDGLPMLWRGEWRSAKHRGMHGRLQCFLTKIDDTHYRARFRAGWLAFTSSYTVDLDTRRAADGLHLNGVHQLRGIGGGLYRYDGKVTSSRFTASYKSNYDTGTFLMKPAPH